MTEMEIIQQLCPMCGMELVEDDSGYTCAEHGRWYSYGAKLLVRAPHIEETTPEHVVMPWEHPVPVV